MAAEPLVLKGEQDPGNIWIAQHLETFEDPSGEITVDEVASGAHDAAFTPARTSHDKVTLTRSAYWGRFTLVNDSDEKIARHLVIEFPNHQNFTLFLPQEDGSFRRRVTRSSGFLRDTDQAHRFPVYDLAVPPKSSATYYFRVKSPTIWLHLSLKKPAAHFAQTSFDNFFYGAILGVVFCIILYQVAILALSPENSSRALLIFVSACFIILMIQYGYHNVMFGRYGGFFSQHWILFQYLAGAANVYFSRVFLNTKRHYPRLDRYLLAVQWFSVAGAALSLIDYQMVIIPGRISLMVNSPLLLGLAAHMAWKGNRHARMYLLAWAPMIITSMIVVMVISAIIDDTAFTRVIANSGGVTGLLLLTYVVARRIGDARAERDALKEIERRLSGIFDNMIDTYYRFDPEGRFLMVSPSVRSLLGYDPGEMIGRSIGELTGDKQGWKNFRAAMAANGGVIEQYEAPLRRKDGSTIWLSSTARYFRDEAGQMVGIEGTSRNITDKRKYENMLSLARENAEEASRAKSAFLAMMSHEIRTPMNGILGMTRLLMDTKLDARQTDYAETIGQSGATLMGILDDILDFSKLEAGKLEIKKRPLDPAKLCESVVNLMEGQAREEGLKLEYRISDTAPRLIEGDPLRLRQILLNLLSNAIKFTFEGFVRLEVTTVHDQSGSPRLRFAVSDSGIGIPEDKHPRLFKEFSQIDSSTTRQFGGSGLGLAISQRLASLMDSRIEMDSTPGEGSCFWFTLPMPAPANISPGNISPGNIPPGNIPPGGIPVPTVFTETTPAECNDVDPMPGEMPASPLEDLPHLRLLLVEDDAINRKVTQGLLKRFGLQARIAISGGQALEILEEEDFDAILMDVQMPEMDGIETTHAIRALSDPAKASTPIIALTANALPQDVKRYREEGMDGFVPKPTTPELLVDTIIRTVLPQTPDSPPYAPEPPADGQSQSPADPPLVKRETIEILHDQLGAARVLELFSNARRVFSSGSDEIDTDLRNGDFPAIARHAHKLRGALGSLGLMVLADLFGEMERLSRVSADEEKTVRKLAGLMEEIHTAWESSFAELREISAQLAACEDDNGQSLRPSDIKVKTED